MPSGYGRLARSSADAHFDTTSAGNETPVTAPEGVAPMQIRRLALVVACVVGASFLPLAGVGSAESQSVTSKDFQRIHRLVKDHLGRPRQDSAWSRMRL